MSCHHHHPMLTGRRITGQYGKPNLPDGIQPVRYQGDEAFCADCHTHLLVVKESESKFKTIELESEVITPDGHNR